MRGKSIPGQKQEHNISTNKQGTWIKHSNLTLATEWCVFSSYPISLVADSSHVRINKPI